MVLASHATLSALAWTSSRSAVELKIGGDRIDLNEQAQRGQSLTTTMVVAGGGTAGLLRLLPRRRIKSMDVRRGETDEKQYDRSHNAAFLDIGPN